MSDYPGFRWEDPDSEFVKANVVPGHPSLGSQRLTSDQQALLQGMLAMAAQQCPGVVRVQLDKGDDGVYNPWFVVKFQSGLEVVVTTETRGSDDG